LFFEVFGLENPQKPSKNGKEPLKQRNFETHAGFHGNYFRLSVGTTTQNG
jgi:hypothetical protein